MATPASAAPNGSYRQTCRDIQQHENQSLTAECQTRDGSWVRSRLQDVECAGDIANVDGRLVCRDNDERADSGDRPYADRNRDDADNNDRRADRAYDEHNDHPYAESYAHESDRGYDRSTARHDVLSRANMIRRMEHQGYRRVHDLRQIHRESDWRALASWHGRRVVLRLNPYSGRVISSRYL